MFEYTQTKQIHLDHGLWARNIRSHYRYRYDIELSNGAMWYQLLPQVKCPIEYVVMGASLGRMLHVKLRKKRYAIICSCNLLIIGNKTARRQECIINAHI